MVLMMVVLMIVICKKVEDPVFLMVLINHS